MKKRLFGLLLLLGLMLGLSGCTDAAEPTAERLCPVVLERSEAFTADRYALSVREGADASFHLVPNDGYVLTGADAPGAELTRTTSGYTLTLPSVRYACAVAVTDQQSSTRLFYHANGGQLLSGGDAEDWVEVPVTLSHLRWNTEPDGTLFTHKGYTLTSWNTEPDGSGIAVGLGSRTEPKSRLYAQWAAWNAADEFTWEQSGSGAVITGWSGSSTRLVIPAQLGGLPVTGIAAEAFADAPCTEVIFPDTLRTVEPDAFARSAVQTVTLFDTLQTITDYAFSDCTALETLHINAARAPVYSGSYQSTWADKYDRLRSLAGTKKLVLFSGSSARFGYDSEALEEAFPAYQAANMGVFAYTNALPLLDLTEDFLEEGDILLLSPEFDAAKRQFCTTNALDDAFFSLMEADYDLVSRLDLRQYAAVFSALGSYLKTAAGMSSRSYALSPADFDEDGNPVDTPSYNAQGDYILYRPDAADDTPIYGLGVEYTPAAFPQWYLDAANAAWEPLQQWGVHVWLTYSPRNRLAVSADTTDETIAALDAYLRNGLKIPVISRLEDSLLPGRYFYGTDNHLSTHGVALRTEQVIADLRTQMEKEGLQ